MKFRFKLPEIGQGVVNIKIRDDVKIIVKDPEPACISDNQQKPFLIVHEPNPIILPKARMS